MKRLVICILLAVHACAFAQAAADGPAPGLKLTLEAGGAKDVRVSRLAALRVDAGSPVSPFLPAGAFKATFEGDLKLRIKDTCSFSASGRGVLKLTINDQVVLEVSGDDLSAKTSAPVNLKKGANHLRVEYASPAAGDAALRLYWSAKDFLPESLPPLVLAHDPADDALVAQSQLRLGRELAANLRCLKCHTSDVSSDKSAMRELSADTPSLDDVGARYSQAWLAHWINNPHAMRETPRCRGSLLAAMRSINVRRIWRLISSMGRLSPQTATDADSPELVTQGTRLYTTLGCIACHLLPDQKPAADAPVRVSLAFVKTKFLPGALKAFLLQPEKHYQWIRMPNFRLTDEEASALSAFLRSRAGTELGGETTGDAKRGAEVFQSAGCISCHGSKLSNGAKAPSLADVAKGDLAHGCLREIGRSTRQSAGFAIDDSQRAALTAFAKTNFTSLSHDVPAEFAERQIAQLNCAACHSRDKNDDTFSQLKDEIDALAGKLLEDKSATEVIGDQSRPPLTWTGEKLRPQWMAQFIGGAVKYKPRPWLAARMPGFASRAPEIAKGLAEEHGCPTIAPANESPDASLAEAGKKLVSKNGGFACIQCHGVGNMKALAPFEAPAINFAHVTDRLTKEFYDRWVYNPQRVLPGTRMPQFAGSDGKTALKDTFDGDARKQYDAIWNYLLAGEKISPPPSQ